MKKFLLALSLFLTSIVGIQANDGVYFTSGNFLVPIQETDISVAKEILTITIGSDGFAHVDVFYEFLNKGQAKKLTMAFEATSSYNDMEPLNRKGIHPHIKDFSVCMNDSSLTYRNGVVAVKMDNDNRVLDFTPLDLNKWKGYGEVADSLLPENNELYNVELNEYTPFGYAYYFDAQFKPGLNTVHHTYSYRMSYNVAQKFVIPYWLTPAMRWANRQIDDFTLRITSDGSALDFCLNADIFSSVPFKTKGKSNIYYINNAYNEKQIFVDLLPNDTIVWHDRNFQPKENLTIGTPLWEGWKDKWDASDYVVISAQGKAHRYIADSGDNYLVKNHGYALVSKSKSKKVRYSAKKGKGWIYIDTDQATMVNVRQKPTTNSRVVCTISRTPNESPKFYQCLGLVKDLYDKDFSKEWYKVKVDGRVGYVRQRLMFWDSVGF